jgi:glucose-6-phosphate 1-epimerase
MNTTDLDSLNARHGIEGHVQFRIGPGGLVVADVTGERSSLRLVLQGAHIISWIPRDSAPVIWVSEAARFQPGTPIRGGVPICWPWFAMHPVYPTDYPFHGFARTTEWDVTKCEMLGDDSIRLTFRLPISDDHRRFWPHATELWYTVTAGDALELALTTRNTGSETIHFTEALHAYFHVSDIENVGVEGLAGSSFFDKVENMERVEENNRVTFPVKTDRVYRHAGDSRVHDAGLRRSICIAKRDSGSTVVWNPRYEEAVAKDDFGASGSRHMVCVETANAMNNVVTLPPAGEHTLWTRYRVQPVTK